MKAEKPSLILDAACLGRLPNPQKEELRDLVVVHSYANSRDQIKAV